MNVNQTQTWVRKGKISLEPLGFELDLLNNKVIQNTFHIKEVLFWQVL